MIDPSSGAGRRILILGAPGAGKSTLAAELGRRHGLTAIHLDDIYHRPGWTTDPLEVFVAKVRAALSAAPGGWVVEGNYSAIRPLLLSSATTVIWLRLPFWRTYTRVLRRTVRQVATREARPLGNRESLRRTLLSRYSMPVWSLTRRRGLNRQFADAVASVPVDANVVILRSPSEIRAFLDSFRLPPYAESDTAESLSAAG